MIIGLAEAKEAVVRYLESEYSQYPFFVAANDSDDIRAIAGALPHSVKRLNLSDYCTWDGMPDEDAVYQAIQDSPAPLLVSGVGELAMLTGRAELISRLAGQTFAHKVVVLCRDQAARLEAIRKSDSKFGGNRWCALMNGCDVSVVRVTGNVPIETEQGFQALLRAMERCEQRKIYASTQVEIFSDRVIRNCYDAILEREPTFPVPADALDEAQWEQYLQNPRLSTQDPLDWRRFLEYKLRGAGSPYFQLVVAHSKNYEAYRREIYNAILRVDFNSDKFDALYHERKLLLRKLGNAGISEYVNESNCRGGARIHYLTDNTSIERHAIIEEVARVGIEPEVLGKVCPDLQMYLSEHQFAGPGGEFFTQYFEAYKRQKLQNHIDEAFLAQVEEISKPGERRYNALPSRKQLILQLRDADSGLYWMDALGVEFLGYIGKLAREMGLWLETGVGRANLPTLTEFNRDFYDEWTGYKFPKLEKLDDLKHGVSISQDSAGPAFHLAEELGIIRAALGTIKDSLVHHRHGMQSVLLTSDHGASRLCVLNRHENGCEIKSWPMDNRGMHGGRCCLKSDTDHAPESATEGSDFWVLSNYDRFRGGRQADIEVHGGASLEEVLVPVIKFTLANEEIHCAVPEADGSLPAENVVPTVLKPDKGDVIMHIFCSKANARLMLIIKGKRYEGVPGQDSNIFDVNLSAHGEYWSPTTTYEAVAYDGDNELHKLSFRVKRATRPTRNTDDGMDFFM